MPRRARHATVHPIALRELSVLRVSEVTTGMLRITLSGDQLGAHTTDEGIQQGEFVSAGFDDDVRLVFPYPGETVPVLPKIKDGAISYPRSPKVLSKVYTVRHHNPQARELSIDFVRHGVGVATTWASRARPGDRIYVLGPFASLALPVGFDWMLIAGDETALPAIARLLEELPDSARAQVFIEIADDSHQQPLPEAPGVVISWLSRNGAEPGTTSLLLDAVRSAPWWSGRAFAWVAGEQAIVRDLRRHLTEERGLDKSAIDFTGYWKRQVVVTLDADASIPDPERNEEAYEKLHELSELLPPLAIRAAINLGIADHLARGVAALPALAAAVGADERALGKLMRYLTVIQLVATNDDRYSLTEVGDFLTDDYVVDQLHRDGVQGQKERALLGLESAIVTGRAAYEKVTGRDYQSLRADEPFARRVLEDSAQYAGYFIAPIASSAALSGSRHVVIHGDGAATLAAELLARDPDVRVTIPALPTAAGWLRDDLDKTVTERDQHDRLQIIEQSLFEQTPAADTVVILYALVEHPDAESALILRRAADSLEAGGRVVLVESTFDTDVLDEHDAEYDLLSLAAHGSGYRTETELTAVISDAGLSLSRTEATAWGTTLRELQPILHATARKEHA